MELVNEEDDRAIVLDFLDGVLNALFKFATVLRACHHAAEVEAQDLLVEKFFGHVTCHDFGGETLGDGGFAYAGLADKAGVILGAAGEDLDDAANLVVAADDGVKLALSCGLRQIAGKLGEGFAHLFGVFGGVGVGAHRHGAGFRQLLLQIRVHMAGVNAYGAEDAESHIAALAENAHQKMLRADVGCAHAAGLRHRQLHHALGAGREALCRSEAAVTATHAPLYDACHHLVGEAVLGEHAVGKALLAAEKAEKEMLTAHIAVTQFLCRLLGEAQDFLCVGGESVFIHRACSPFLV